MARDHVVARSRDASGNVMGRFHTNKILDTRMYHFEFAGGEVTKLTANVIAESTFAGWKICCQWKDGSISWEKLSKLTESHPVQTAEFADAQWFDHEPAFNWWVKHVLKNRDMIIAIIRKWQTRYLKKSHQFDIELP